jgi:glycosyltransferase involved in cell wall biosynthesis
MTMHEPSSTCMGEPVHCVTILDELPGQQRTNLRKSSAGIPRWLKKAQNHFLRRLRPYEQLSPPIRGARVAIDYVLQALLAHSTNARFSFVVPDSALETYQRWAESLTYTHASICIWPFSKVLGSGLDELAPDIWLNLHGDNHFPIRLRDQLSHRTYPTVTLQHGISYHTMLYDKFFRTMLTPTYSADTLICTSGACAVATKAIFESLAASFFGRHGVSIGFKGRLDIIPLCVDTDYFKPGEPLEQRKRLSIPPRATTLLYIGYLSQIKADVAAVIPLIPRLQAANPSQQLHFVIAGTGPEEYTLQLNALIQELNLTKEVQILKNVTDEKKLALLQAADIFVAPCESMQESFGLTPVEAMACGLPQVVADWSGYRETVKHAETGFLVPTIWAPTDSDLAFSADLFGWHYDHIHQGQSIILDAEVLFSSLNTLIQDTELRLEMSRASRARALSEYSPARLASRYENLWNELLNQSQQSLIIRGGNGFDSVHYLEYFGHFATKILRGSYQVMRGSSTLSLDRLLLLAESATPGSDMLNRDLLQEVMLFVKEQSDAGLIPTIASILGHLCHSDLTEAYVRRHIAYLSKFGMLRLTAAG